MPFNFKVGDEVVRMWHRYGGPAILGFATVERVTTPFFIVLGVKYDSKTGHEYGSRHSSGYIVPSTREIKVEFEEQTRRSRRHEFLSTFLNNWTRMGEDNLDKVAAALGFNLESETKDA